MVSTDRLAGGELARKFENDILMHSEDAKFAIGYGISYAQLALKWAFTLNGGALVAIPAIVQAFEGAEGAIWSAIALVVGLALAAGCSLMAYLNFLAISAVETTKSTKLRWLLSSINDPEKVKDRVEECDRHIASKNEIVGWTYYAGVFLGTGSHSCFIGAMLYFLVVNA